MDISNFSIFVNRFAGNLPKKKREKISFPHNSQVLDSNQNFPSGIAARAYYPV
jgi:hypothetical protein